MLCFDGSVASIGLWRLWSLADPNSKGERRCCDAQKSSFSGCCRRGDPVGTERDDDGKGMPDALGSYVSSSSASTIISSPAPTTKSSGGFMRTVPSRTTPTGTASAKLSITSLKLRPASVGHSCM